jgi:glycosyltransferase involved in cell wall biosynthesis
MRVLVPLAARRAHRVLAVSAATGRDVQRLLKVPENRIDVVPHGLGTTGAPPPLPEAELRARHDLHERPIVLCVAAKRPHKNLGRLIGALALIPGERRPVLVLVGYATAHQDELEQRAAHLAVTGDVRFLDWVAQDELEGLYAIAAAFVLPSLHEGFGLPVLEAMARGVPVACSARGALAEVAGDAALTFDPMSEPAIAAAIERLIGDRAEAARLREAGRARAATFSWEAAARGTLDCYARALS